jgi:hypothetical protein
LTSLSRDHESNQLDASTASRGLLFGGFRPANKQLTSIDFSSYCLEGMNDIGIIEVWVALIHEIIEQFQAIKNRQLSM